ncbi:MAG TPA: TetR/AcrR family transcriptional regulator [Pseudonocardia sp.]|nr:TetR/AcrR family transcriptional regulator [Pseudonocardia sp.]
MPRASRADAARHHEEVIGAAARLFRERGIGSVSVPEVMAEAGLTRGGFYKHFESKDALVTTAVEAAFAEQLARVHRFTALHPDDPGAAHREMLDYYLSPEHRDDPGAGCPNAALASEVAHTEPGSGPRAAFAAGMRTMLQAYGAESAPGAEPNRREAALLLEIATLAGALMLARATEGDELSDRILAAVRRSFDRPSD